MAEFAINNKTHLTTKISPFIANYGRELRMKIDIRRKEKIEKTTKFAEKMKKVQEKAGVALKRTLEKMKKQADRRRKEAEVWKVGNKMILSIKYLVFKE